MDNCLWLSCRPELAKSERVKVKTTGGKIRDGSVYDVLMISHVFGDWKSIPRQLSTTPKCTPRTVKCAAMCVTMLQDRDCKG
jgi:hypothetical protein